MVWLKDGDPVNYTDRVYVSGYDASLQFSTVVHGDEGVYSVRLANEYDEVTSSNASLLVTGKLKKERVLSKDLFEIESPGLASFPGLSCHYS